ncbi:MAG: exodeoxyribonuclease VII small subunit [Lachnospiraceae bacterium]|nr:exodeoxyribonuclease VII small subunit [Lachnospiraceae bacterium]
METTEKKIADMTIEETFAALDALIDQLESGKGSLEDAFKNYEEGMKLVKSCNEKIEKIEKQILVLGRESMEDTNNGQYF